MHEATLNQSQELLLRRFEEIGGCVDYVVVECDSEQDVSVQETHRKAAIAGLKIIAKRLAAYAAKTSAEQNIPIERIFSMTIDHKKADALECKGISDREFLGTEYDYDHKKLIERPSKTGPAGYAYAFSDPPYRLRVSLKEATKLFDAINKEILGGISPESVIFEWPVDWSDYFDAGQEWWGSFLWTFANPGARRIVVLAASTTD